jgi:deazaflavin-dependent oxidoreductase (nitroreductase family)
MPNWDPKAFEDAIIADMRAHDGAVTEGPLAGHLLMALTMIGAKSGEPRRVLLTYSRDGDDYIVAGSKGGSPTDPIWLNNLRANPEVTIEAGNQTFTARATIVDDAEQPRLWNAHVERWPHFADYPSKAGRVIPIVRLTPVTAPVPVTAAAPA